MYDLIECTYVDTTVQKSRIANANNALVDMVDRYKTSSPAIIITDRG
jgi:hypothetical protein